MTSALPDGTCASAYAYLREGDRAGLMWEWLRRDAAYIGWYVRARAATRGNLPAAPRWRLLLAEDPRLTVPRARVLWRADLDPGALHVIARPAAARDPAALPIHRLRRFLSVVRGADGCEHALLSNGHHHIRLEVEEGTLQQGPVVLHYLLCAGGDPALTLATVRRLAALCRERRFSPEQYPPDPQRERYLLLLRVGDAIRSGASQRDVAHLLVGAERVRTEWQGPSDSLRSRVRRLVAQARWLAAGGYRLLLGGDSSDT